MQPYARLKLANVDTRMEAEHLLTVTQGIIRIYR